jgi:hypothetical protein
MQILSPVFASTCSKMPGTLCLFLIAQSNLSIYRKHVKVEDAPLSQIAQLEDTDVEAAKKEWEVLVLTDEE